MTQLIVWILLAAAQALPGGKAVVVFEDRHRPPVQSEIAGLRSLSEEPSSIAWIWSDSTPPRRTEIPGLDPVVRTPAGAFLTVRIAGEPDSKIRLELIAAPAAMWEEVPENLLPSWTVAPGGSVRIPTDRGEIWRVRIAGPGLGSWWTDVLPARPSVTVVPVEAQARELHVVDETGADLPGVRVSFLDEAPQRGDWKKFSEYSTDDHGRVRLPSLPDVAPVLMVASTPDRAPRVMSTRVAALPESLTLPPGASLTGRLSDREGKPIPGARVAVRTWVAESLPIPLIRSADSKADGTFEVKALPHGRAEWRGKVDGFAIASRGLSIDHDRVDLGRIVLQPELKLPVEVRDDRGEAVSGARLVIEGSTAGTTAVNGKATIPAASGQPFEMNTFAEGHLPATTKVAYPFPSIVRVAITRSFRVTGRLTDPSGRPLPKASVDAHKDRGSFSHHQLEADGRFALDLEPGVEYQLELRSAQSGTATVDLPAGTPGEIHDLGDIVAPTGIAVTGRLVRTMDDTPVAGARVWVPRPSPNGPLLSWAFRDILETVSDSDGRFELAGLPPTPFLLRIEGAELAPYRQPVSPEDGEQSIDLGEIRLGKGSTVVVDVTETPDEGTEVRLDLGGRGLPMDLLHAPLAKGRATFHDVPAGRVVAAAWRDRDLICREEADITAEIDANISCTPQKVSLTGLIQVGGQPTGPGTVVWLTPVDPDVPSAIFNFGSGSYLQQHALKPDGAHYSVNVGFDGSFSTSILPGAWDVLWMPEAGQALGPRRVVIPEAAAYHVVLAYPAAVVRGIVLDAQRHPVPHAEVRELNGRGFARTGEGGSFVLAGPPPGEWKIQARYAGNASAIRNVLVEEGRETEPVELVLDAPPEVIHVRVLADGKPSPGSIVFVETDLGELRFATADTNATAEFRFDEPKPHRLRAAASAGGRWTLGTWTTADEAANGLNLQVVSTGALVVVSDGPAGSITIGTQDGWRLERLLQWIGSFATVAPSTPLLLSGLPEGTYEIAINGKREAATIKRDETTTLHLQ